MGDAGASNNYGLAATFKLVYAKVFCLFVWFGFFYTTQDGPK
jgi:hypothetical protein